MMEEAFGAFVAWCATAQAEFDRIQSSVRYDGGRFSLVAVDGESGANSGAPSLWKKITNKTTMY
jgi:hypothetical protein